MIELGLFQVTLCRREFNELAPAGHLHLPHPSSEYDRMITNHEITHELPVLGFRGKEKKVAQETLINSM